MPTSVIIAYAASAAGAYIAGSALAYSAIISMSWVTYAGIQAASSFVVSAMLNNAINGGGGGGGQVGVNQQVESRTRLVRSPVATREIVYGTILKSGVLVQAVSSTEGIPAYYSGGVVTGSLTDVSVSTTNYSAGRVRPRRASSGNHVFTRVSGSFVDDGFVVGQVVRWDGFNQPTTTDNGSENYVQLYGIDTTEYTIETLTATVMTMARIDNIQNLTVAAGASVKCGQTLYYIPTVTGEYLYLVVVWASHACRNVTGFMFNDVEVGALDGNGEPTGGDFFGHVKITNHLGEAGQAADSDLMNFDSNWTTAHRLDGLCYSVIRLKFNPSIFPTGIPNIRAVVYGKTLYDIRTAADSVDENDNPVLATYDYLVNYMGVPTTMIDSSSFIAAANICDEAVTLKAGGTERRYTANGVLKSETKHRANVQQLLTACGGTITCPQGSYVMTVAAYSPPVLQLDEDDLRGALKVRAAVSKKQLFNAVKGQFVDPNRYYQAADFTPVTNATYATDDGEQIFNDLQLPFTTSNTTAQRLARIMLEKSRQGITVEMPCKLNALQLQPMDCVQLNISHLGWDFPATIDEMTTAIDSWGYIDDSIGGKIFRVMSVTLSPDGGIDLTLQEEASACYEWSESETNYDLAPNTTLPDTFSIAPPGNVQMTESLFATTGSSGIRAKAIVTWDAPSSGYVNDYELEYKQKDSATWIEIFNIRGTRYEFFDLTPAVYDFRVKSRNILNVVSDYTVAKRFTVYGLTAVPGDVANFSVAPINGTALASWDLTSDLDVKIGGDVNIKYSALTTGAVFADGFTVASLNGDATSAILPLATGTYMAKFIDSTGNYSDTEATFNVTEALLAAWTTVTTTTQHATFTGTKTGCEVSGSNLIMSATYSEATYAFSATVDMTTSATRRYHGHMKVRGYNETDTFDSTEDFDSAESFDETGSVDDSDAYLMIRTTTDDPAGSPTWTAWQKFVVADFYARAAQFKTILTRASLSNNIELQELSVAIKIPT